MLSSHYPKRCLGNALAAQAYEIESANALAGLEEDMVMEDFQDMLEAHSGIAPEDQDVLVGEPPRSLQVQTLIHYPERPQIGHVLQQGPWAVLGSG